MSDSAKRSLTVAVLAPTGRDGPLAERVLGRWGIDAKAMPTVEHLVAALDNERVVTVQANGKPGKFSRLDIKAAKDEVKILGPDSVVIGNVLTTKGR